MASGPGVHQRRAELQLESLRLAPKLKETQSKASISKLSLPPKYFCRGSGGLHTANGGTTTPSQKNDESRLKHPSQVPRPRQYRDLLQILEVLVK